MFKDTIRCPHCGSDEFLYNKDGVRNNFCGRCGHKIEWLKEENGWHYTTQQKPDFGRVCKIKYGNGATLIAALSSIIGWHEPEVFNSLATPEYWKYLED